MLIVNGYKQVTVFFNQFCRLIYGLPHISGMMKYTPGMHYIVFRC